MDCVRVDPAAEVFNYPVSIDVRELISLDEAMDELDLGPNGCVLFLVSALYLNLNLNLIYLCLYQGLVVLHGVSRGEFAGLAARAALCVWG